MRNGERGTALAETIVVAPLLLLLVIAFSEVGRYADYSLRLANAARAGVQYGAQNIVAASDSSGMAAAAQADAAGLTGLTVTASNFCTCADGTADAGCVVATCSATHRVVYAEVDATGTLSALYDYPLLPANLRSINVSRVAIMRVAE